MATTLYDIREEVRSRASIENNPFLPDDQLDVFINNSLAELYGELIRSYEDYNVTFFQTVLAGGAYNTIMLPSDFLKIRKVDYRPNVSGVSGNDDTWYSIYQFQMTEKNRYNNPTQNIMSPWGKINLSYHILANNVIIEPQDECTGEFRVYYAPKWIKLENDGDSLPLTMDSNGWVEYSIAGACVKIMNKLRLPDMSQMYAAEKVELMARVKSECKNRDSGGPKRMANVRGMQSNLWGNLGGGEFGE